MSSPFRRLRHRVLALGAGPIGPLPRPATLADARRGANINVASVAVIETAPVWMSPAERLLLYTLAFTLRPARYLEIGTLHGGSALIVCTALDTIGATGTITCLDPNPQIAPETWAQLAGRTTVITGYSPGALAEAMQRAGGKFDLVLVDGDHSYDGALRDLNGVLAVAAPGAHVLCHDCLFVEVQAAIDDFVVAHPRRVADLGVLTRETTVDAQAGPEPTAAETWGGMRVVRVV